MTPLLFCIYRRMILRQHTTLLIEFRHVEIFHVSSGRIHVEYSAWTDSSRYGCRCVAQALEVLRRAQVCSVRDTVTGNGFPGRLVSEGKRVPKTVRCSTCRIAMAASSSDYCDHGFVLSSRRLGAYLLCRQLRLLVPGTLFRGSYMGQTTPIRWVVEHEDV